MQAREEPSAHLRSGAAARLERGRTAPVPQVLFADVREDRWRSRVRASRDSLPMSGRSAASARSIYASNRSGTREIHAWDRRTDSHRQVTHRAEGTLLAAITPDGQWIWWFADTDGDEFGRWMHEPFEAGSADPVPATAGVPDGYSAGLALGERLAVIGMTGDWGTSVWTLRHGQAARQIYSHAELATVHMLSADDELVVVDHAEHGDPRNPGIRVFRTSDGAPVGERRDPGTQLIPLGFPSDGSHQLLVNHERRGRTELLLWDLDTDTDTEIRIALPGDLRGCWAPGAGQGTRVEDLVVVHDRAGRSTLHRWHLPSGELHDLPAAEGCISEFAGHPATGVEYEWSSAASPWTVRGCSFAGVDRALLPPRAEGAAPASVPVREEWIAGPAGPVHTLISAPDGAAVAPQPVVVRLHGGPHAADRDEYSPMRAAWIDAGYTVVQPNYRGSTGYGADWRNSIAGRPGLTELEDVMVVVDWCTTTGLADPGKILIEGYSWGGFLALLAAGREPSRWAGVIAGLPVADYVAAYEQEAEPLKALDRALFGGTPDEVAQVYRAASPMTYVESVTAPVLVLAGRNDPRCPIGQIENYVDALDELGRAPLVLRYAAGHGSHVTEMVETFIAANIAFARSVTA